MMTTPTIEQATQVVGKEIFRRIGGHAPSIFERHWWEERMLEWMMTDEQTKVQMFRFIDVLPVLRTAGQIRRHLDEYFADLDNLLPAAVRRGVDAAQTSRLASRALAIGVRKNADIMARRFIAGATVTDAVAAARRLRKDRMGFSIDILGEAVTSESAAAAYERQYLAMIDALGEAARAWRPLRQVDVGAAGPVPRVNVSVKLSALCENFDPIDPEGTGAKVKARLRRILGRARRGGAFINFDMEQYAYKDLTLRIFREILLEDDFRDWPDVGLAVQAYLRDTRADLRDLAEWAEERGTPITVRLVKGAYWDYETITARQRHWPVPVFTRKAETDANFETLSAFLLKNHEHLRPAIASHNVRSIAHAIATAPSMGLPDDLLEFQLLYGMGDRIKHALVEMGLRVRVYTPCGELIPGMGYLVRRLLENTANESFLRQSFSEEHSEEELLAPPVVSEPDDGSVGSRAVGEGAGEQPPSDSAAADAFSNEPLTDFARAEARRRMRRALETVGTHLGGEHRLVIGDKEPMLDATIISVNPAHKDQIVGVAAAASREEAETAVAAATAAFPAWRDTLAQKRAEYLLRAADVMRRRRFELAAWQVHECAKQWREADGDVAEAIDYLEFYACEMLLLAKARRRDVPGEENEYFYEGRGVSAVIAPWNFPLAIITGMTAAAVVAGNTVVMKPAEQSPVIASLLMDILREVELPPGVVNYLPGVGEEIGPTLVTHPDVALIAFTGSRAVGTLINELAAGRSADQRMVKRVIAEMGGKNAIIVDDDADLDEAVLGVLVSAFGYAGQKCSACSRVIAVGGVYDGFVRRLVDSTESLTIGPPDDPGNQVGPVIDAEAQARILRRIETARSEGTVLVERDVSGLAEEGFYVPPTIVGDISPEASTCQEEIFGPVLAVLRAESFEEAVTIANGTAYALTGGLYSRSPRHIREARATFRVGNLYVNRKITGAEVDRQPFGGFKMSGIGSKAGGPDYLLQFLIPRTFTENTIRRGFAPESD